MVTQAEILSLILLPPMAAARAIHIRTAAARLVLPGVQAAAQLLTQETRVGHQIKLTLAALPVSVLREEIPAIILAVAAAARAALVQSGIHQQKHEFPEVLGL